MEVLRFQFASFTVLTSVKSKFMVFWVVPFSVVVRYHCFRGLYCMHLQPIKSRILGIICGSGHTCVMKNKGKVAFVRFLKGIKANM
jgi:hypothetical protein